MSDYDDTADRTDSPPHLRNHGHCPCDECVTDRRDREDASQPRLSAFREAVAVLAATGVVHHA